MSYDLVPRNKELEPLYFGAFSWSWMLRAGVGLVIGTGDSIVPASYRYMPDKRGRDPNSNDGFHVTSKQAKLMAEVAKGLLSVEYGKHKEYEEASAAERERWDAPGSLGTGLYHLPVRKDFLEKVERFVEWAPKSGGFWIR